MTARSLLQQFCPTFCTRYDLQAAWDLFIGKAFFLFIHKLLYFTLFTPGNRNDQFHLFGIIPFGPVRGYMISYLLYALPP